MAIIILVNFFVFLVVGAIVTGVGFDLRKWSSWLFGAYGFLSERLKSHILANLRTINRIIAM